MTFDDVAHLCANWPEVSVSTSYSTPAPKARSATFCRLWGERDRAKADVGGADVLVVFCDLDEKTFLLDESDGAVFSAPHYDGYGAVLVRLDLVTAPELRSLLIDSYLEKAPATLRRRLLDLEQSEITP